MVASKNPKVWPNDHHDLHVKRARDGWAHHRKRNGQPSATKPTRAKSAPGAKTLEEQVARAEQNVRKARARKAAVDAEITAHAIRGGVAAHLDSEQSNAGRALRAAQTRLANLKKKLR